MFKKKINSLAIDEKNLPVHIAIIMDGNGRWAKKRGLPRTAGHLAGSDALVKIARYCYDIGVKHLTVYAFSTENWKRSEDEVSGLMKLFLERLPQLESLMQGREVAIRFLGDIKAFSPTLIKMMEAEEARTEKYACNHRYLNICVNYGSQDEIVNATKQIANAVLNGELNVNTITKEIFSNYLYTAHLPEPDLIIRPSGEVRISNFLLYQSAYSEFYYDHILWPDFSPKDLNRAIIEFQKRSRRFGG